MTKLKVLYGISTGLLTALICMGAGMYFFKHAEIEKAFTGLGYPTYLIYPLAVAKLLGLLAIWTRISPLLMKLAYAGFFFTFVLAFSAHLNVGDGDWPGAVIAMTLLMISFLTGRLAFEEE